MNKTELIEKMDAADIQVPVERHNCIRLLETSNPAWIKKHGTETALAYLNKINNRILAHKRGLANPEYCAAYPELETEWKRELAFFEELHAHAIAAIDTSPAPNFQQRNIYGHHPKTNPTQKHSPFTKLRENS